MQRGVARLTDFLVPIDEFYPWIRAARAEGISLVRHFDIDLIWTTTPPISGLHLAQQIAQRTGVPYVVDFRDVEPLGGAARASWKKRTAIRVEREVVSGAVGVTYVAPPQRAVLFEKHPEVANKPHLLVRNWFHRDEIARCEPRRFEQPTILHGGGLYGGARRLTGFIEGLARLRERKPADNGAIRFLQLGNHPRDVKNLIQQASRLNLGNGVRCQPPVPRRDFLSACLGADILLVVVGHDTDQVIHQGAIPGKLYDYFAAGKPILVVGPRNCEAGMLVEQLNRGVAVPDDRPDQVADAIERLLSGNGRSGKLDLSGEAVREFESSSAVAKMAAFCHSIVSQQSLGEVKTATKRVTQL